MKTVLIINKDLPRKEIIRDIAKEAREIGYNRDNVLRRCLMGIMDYRDENFYSMVRKIIKQELPIVKEIIRDIAKEAREIGYNRDNVLRRCLMGIMDYRDENFYSMVRKIIKQELPIVKEIMIMKNETFEKYIEM